MTTASQEAYMEELRKANKDLGKHIEFQDLTIDLLKEIIIEALKK